MIRASVLAAVASLAIACSGEVDSADAGPPVDFGGPVSPPSAEAGLDAAPLEGYATRVVSFTPGACSGFGSAKMPAVVLGPPKGAGSAMGSFDVVSLGKSGQIVLSLEPNAIVDGEGVDFIVYENAIVAAGTTSVFADPGEVSVSDDGIDWKTFPCTATEPPWGACAGWHPVEADGSGGDPFDLADVGVKRARFIRIVDKTTGATCTSDGPNNYGFDLDAIRAVHTERP